jgi:hypothetical protein
VSSSSSPPRSLAEGTAADVAAPAAVTVPDCGETSLTFWSVYHVMPITRSTHTT